LGAAPITFLDALAEQRASRTAFPQRIEPGPGQESVWDYPRPPRLEQSSRHIHVVLAGQTIAETWRALRVCETSGPPVYYLLPDDVRLDCLEPAAGTTVCEWKGIATYFDARLGDRLVRRAAWAYADPRPEYAALRDHIAFYPRRVDACYLDGELVMPQPGDYYGGWITREIVGPFKGGPGTLHW
jgi:uncharacterized protein (DUF427 family)